MNPALRVVSLAGGLLLVIPGTVTDVAGIVLIVLVLVLTSIANKKKAAA